MVELMKFTRDICRLLGIGGEGSSDQEEMEYGGGDPAGQRDGDGQDALSGEEGLSEGEKARRRTEKRRAKRKRQRERKKLEKEGKSEDAGRDGDEEDGDDDDGGASSESDSGSEEERGEELVVYRRKDKPDPPLATSVNKSNRQPPCKSTEEEPEWDVSSAFVANAASHIRPKGRTRAGLGSKENKENEGRASEVNSTDAMKKRGASLTEKGIRLFQQGQYSQAVDMFTEAVQCDPKDYRFFGNRSYCYWCLEQYPAALSDAQRSIQLAPDWPKGYFRKGSALMGMKRYGEAEKAMQQVLKLDKDCGEADDELLNCRVLQLMELGFGEVQSVLLLEKFTTVHAALTSPEAAKVVDLTSQLDQCGAPCPSLWVGNITLDLTEKHLWDLFKTCGEIDSIRVLHERFCAFVNFRNANMAARALERLQGVELENTRLVIRYPDRWMQRAPPSPQRTASCFFSASQQADGSRRRGPVNGDECFFWRTTGCLFGDKCRYKHVPDQRGRDKKPWQP